MNNFISDFITDIVNNGIIPKSTNDIAPSDRFKRIQSVSDKGAKRSISYWLRIEHDFSYGYAKDFKTGLERRFKSYSKDPNLTRADIMRIKSMLKARKAEEDAAIAERHAKIATRAAAIYAQLPSTGVSPYAERKNINPISARYQASNLWIPIYDHDQLVSYQVIKPDGEKRFPFGGKKHGCWHPIGQIDPTKPIIICEGYATGATISEATGKSVVVAFDAGNLLPVAKALRAIYKTTPIIIAADNDLNEVGLKAATSVTQAVKNSKIILCPVSGKDFNDIGLKATKEAFEGGGESSDDVLQPHTAPAVSDFSWQNNLITDSRNRIVTSSTQNAILYMLYHEDFAGVFAYDEFKQNIILRRCPPWMELDKFNVVSLSDIHITQASATLERYGLSCGIDKCSKAIDVVADCNKFHSARIYFSQLEWDGVPRLETFCVDHLGSTKESPEYLSFVFKKWMTAAVKRVFDPACKFDHVLILESQKQGLYKSQLLKTLATFGGECYHTDSVTLTDLENKDTIMKMQGNIIVELAEMSGFSRKEDSQIKNWMTQTRDEIRIPFSRKIVSYPRQFVFAATTNDTDYLRDPTGNRRYWMLTVEKIIDIDSVMKVKDQLWAEAYALYKSGLYIGPTIEENELAEYERSKRMQSDAWEDIVMGAVDRIGLDEFKTSDILGKMDLKTGEKNERAARRISSILKMNGYVNEPQWDNKAKKSVRVWSKPL